MRGVVEQDVTVLCDSGAWSDVERVVRTGLGDPWENWQATRTSHRRGQPPDSVIPCAS